MLALKDRNIKTFDLEDKKLELDNLNTMIYNMYLNLKLITYQDTQTIN